MRELRCLIGVVAILAAVAAVAFVLQTKPAFAQDKEYEGFKEVVVEQYGYKMMIPKEFALEGKIDKTTSWSFQPGAAAKPAEEKTPAEAKPKKKLGIGGALKKGVGLGETKVAETPAADAGSGGGLEPALTIYVNWVWMPDVSSKTLYDANIKQTKEDIASPDPDYKDIQTFDKKKGYKWEGLAFWYKEVDKPANEQGEIHRWHIEAFNEKSDYTIGLCGTYKQFEKWGPIYEKVIKSFEFIPLKK